MTPDHRPRQTHHLSPLERAMLAHANWILTELTRAHCPFCDCEMCDARVLTDCQDEAAYHVPFVPSGSTAANN